MSFQKEQMKKLDFFSSEFADLIKRDIPTKDSTLLDDGKDSSSLLNELNMLFADKQKRADLANLNDILELNKVLTKLEGIKELTDEIDNFESKLRILDQLIQTDGDLREIEKVFILMKECINVTRNMSLFEEKNEKIEYYEARLKEHLDSKVGDVIQNDDVETMQSLLRLYSVMGKDEEFLGVLIDNKFFLEFQALKQLKKLSMGSTHYYFESLQEYIEKRVDGMLAVFPAAKCVRYLTVVFERISTKFIEAIVQDFIENDQSQSKEDRLNHKIFTLMCDSQREKWLYIMEKMSKINDVLRAKIIEQIHDYEMAENKEQLQDPS